MLRIAGRCLRSRPFGIPRFRVAAVLVAACSSRDSMLFRLLSRLSRKLMSYEDASSYADQLLNRIAEYVDLLRGRVYVGRNPQSLELRMDNSHRHDVVFVPKLFRQWTRFLARHRQQPDAAA